MINTKLCKACSFLSIVYWNVHVSSSGKSSFWACWFFQPSSLPDFLQKPICIAPASSALPAQHFAVWLYRTLQCSGLQWAPVTELNDFFFQFAFLSPPLGNFSLWSTFISSLYFSPFSLLIDGGVTVPRSHSDYVKIGPQQIISYLGISCRDP